MKKIFHCLSAVFRRRFSSRRNRLLALGAIFLSIFIYLVLAMLTVSSAELDLEKLRRSFAEDIICHEVCAADREAARVALVKGIKSDPGGKGARLLKKYFLDEGNEINFRLSLVSIISETDGVANPPDYVGDFMNSSGNPLIRAEILGNFEATSLAAVDNPLDYYYGILSGEDDLLVKLAAVKAISALSEEKYFFGEGQLSIIKKLILNSGTAKRLRQPLILLLGDYYFLFPEETSNILAAFYSTDVSGDSISRAFAVDILNRLGGENLAIPEVTPAEWEDYYNE
jgi:hypothetical protein